MPGYINIQYKLIYNCHFGTFLLSVLIRICIIEGILLILSNMGGGRINNEQAQKHDKCIITKVLVGHFDYYLYY